jgi:hypothetical protein
MTTLSLSSHPYTPRPREKNHRMQIQLTYANSPGRAVPGKVVVAQAPRFNLDTELGQSRHRKQYCHHDDFEFPAVLPSRSTPLPVSAWLLAPHSQSITQVRYNMLYCLYSCLWY